MADSLIDILFIETSDGLAEPNLAGRSIECVRAIIDSDPGFNGIKEIARKELAYVYFTLKREAFVNFTPEERDNAIRKQVGLLALRKKWEPSEQVKQAILQLTEPLSAQEKLLIKARQNLEDYLVLFEENNKAIRKNISILQEDDTKKITMEDLKTKQALIEEGKKHFKDQVSYIKELNDAFNLVDSLETQIKETKKKKGLRDKRLFNELEEDLSLYEK